MTPLPPKKLPGLGATVFTRAEFGTSLDIFSGEPITTLAVPAPSPVMVPDPALVREIELSYGNRRQRRAFDRTMALKGKTVLKDRDRDTDGHLLPVHPQDRRKGPR